MINLLRIVTSMLFNFMDIDGKYPQKVPHKLKCSISKIIMLPCRRYCLVLYISVCHCELTRQEGSQILEMLDIPTLADTLDEVEPDFPPLSTAYTVCESFGLENSVSRELKDASIFSV